MGILKKVIIISGVTIAGAGVAVGSYYAYDNFQNRPTNENVIENTKPNLPNFGDGGDTQKPISAVSKINDDGNKIELMIEGTDLSNNINDYTITSSTIKSSISGWTISRTNNGVLLSKTFNSSKDVENILGNVLSVEHKGKNVGNFLNRKRIELTQVSLYQVRVQQATNNAFIRNALGSAIIEWSKAIGKDIKVVNNDEQLTALRQGRDAMLNGIGLLDQFINYVKEGRSPIISFSIVESQNKPSTPGNSTNDNIQVQKNLIASIDDNGKSSLFIKGQNLSTNINDYTIISGNVKSSISGYTLLVV